MSFVFVQELVFDAVCKLQGSVTDNADLPRLLGETRANIDNYRSVSHELRDIQVYV